MRWPPADCWTIASADPVYLLISPRASGKRWPLAEDSAGRPTSSLPAATSTGAGNFRRARPGKVHGPPVRHQYASAGAGAFERSDIRGSITLSGRAHDD